MSLNYNTHPSSFRDLFRLIHNSWSAQTRSLVLPLTQLITRFFPAALQLGLAPQGMVGLVPQAGHKQSECLGIWEVWYPGSTVSRYQDHLGSIDSNSKNFSQHDLFEIDPLQISISHERPGNSCKVQNWCKGKHIRSPARFLSWPWWFETFL